MKKILRYTVVAIFAVSMCFALAGCTNQKDIMSEYYDLLANEVNEENVKATGAYLDKYLDKMDEEQADYMVMLYEDYVKAYDSEYINYGALRNSYGDSISKMLDEFYFIKSFEYEFPLEKDGKLNYDWNEIVLRAMNVEKYIKEYKTKLNSEEYSKLKTNVTFEYEFYIRNMLQGTVANPTFNYQTGIFDENATDIYLKLADENHGTVTAWSIDQYFKYLQSVGFLLDYKDSGESKTYFDTCSYITSEAGKRVYQ